MKRERPRSHQTDGEPPVSEKRRRLFRSHRARPPRPRLRERVLAGLLAPLSPALVGHSPAFPEVDGRSAAARAAEMICGGPYEVFLTVLSGVLALDTYSVLRTGRPLRSLKRERQSELLSDAFHSRFFLFRGTSVLVGLPVKIAFYNQDDVCRELGYDRAALIEDALKHQVTRGG